jgi:hypothetical protein
MLKINQLDEESPPPSGSGLGKIAGFYRGIGSGSHTRTNN